MTRLARRIASLTLLGVVGLPVAPSAGVPDPANAECRNVGAQSLGFSCSAGIYIVGENGTGVADPLGEYCVIVRDLLNQPVPNATILIDFSACGVQLCADQHDPGVVVDCVNRTVRKVTDATGTACFRVVGKSANTGCGDPLLCAGIWWDGVFLCSVAALPFDLISQGGEDGMNPNDLSEWLRLFFNCADASSRINYQCSDTYVDPNDLSVFLSAGFAAGSATNCGALGSKCP